jgi:RNA polymerase sigma-70 factor (ECF subfamily)
VTETRDDHRDCALLADLAAGKPQALGQLYGRHAASLLRHALALSRRRPDAEDLVHAVFVKVAAIGAPLLGVRKPASYLHRMLHTAWLDGRRRTVTGERIERKSAGEGIVAHAGVESIDLWRALDRLPPEQREVVVLHVVEGFSFREIGGMTGASMFTAAARYRLAIAKLRAALQPNAEQEGA